MKPLPRPHLSQCRQKTRSTSGEQRGLGGSLPAGLLMTNMYTMFFLRAWLKLYLVTSM